ncbi:hypothetical protein FOA43_003288 [Brettanomyces nanus]|uniref:Uncharacterized protein n=1 Tax=Eeniella nana TaxID=13502 RepID=A0A875S7I8_EENNA|nr:uncharacterized protein FOA43_003288 [Brettanomyces nanus]QPG75902.1 hypothetical protein FOA43_003288 [Brettanomyces nanus]
MADPQRLDKNLDVAAAEAAVAAAVAATTSVTVQENIQELKSPNYFAQLIQGEPSKSSNLDSTSAIEAKDSGELIEPILVVKCSRCRVKRVKETEEMLHKYHTCVNCRMKRRVMKRKLRSPSRLPNLIDDWGKYQQKVATNATMDLFEHNYRNYTDEVLFPRYKVGELNDEIVERISKKLVDHYISPLQMLTGFRFTVRDHHRPLLQQSNRAKKITWMFVCSQDKLHRRESRSHHKRRVINRLKTEECASKITLNYDLLTGMIQMSYNHKHHYPYNWKKHSRKRKLNAENIDAQDVINEFIAQNESTGHQLNTSQIVELATRATQEGRGKESEVPKEPKEPQEPQEPKEPNKFCQLDIAKSLDSSAESLVTEQPTSTRQRIMIDQRLLKEDAI